MVIGGFNSSTTFYFNTENEIWSEGPQLNNKRSSHSCGRIKKDSQSQDLSVIVAGGSDGSSLSSVEILDAGSNAWRNGPELPVGIDLAQLVEVQEGGVVLVGGSSTWDEFLDTLFQLPHGGEDAEWIEMEQKLKIGRNQHVAFLVPDSITDCS